MCVGSVSTCSAPLGPIFQLGQGPNDQQRLTHGCPSMGTVFPWQEPVLKRQGPTICSSPALQLGGPPVMAGLSLPGAFPSR